MASKRECEQAGLQSPRDIGGQLREFAEMGIYQLTADVVCGQCSEEETVERPKCDNCPAMPILGHIENQIGREGIRFMKQLVKDWASAR